MITVRRAQNDSDFRRLYDLFVEYEADLPNELRHGNVPAIAELMERYRDRNGAFLATQKGKPMPVGCTAVAEVDVHTALLLRLFVKAESRGVGLARALVTAAIEFARESGYRRVVLDTDKERLTAAYRLYESLGFQECEPFAPVRDDSLTYMALML